MCVCFFSNNRLMSLVTGQMCLATSYLQIWEGTCPCICLRICFDTRYGLLRKRADDATGLKKCRCTISGCGQLTSQFRSACRKREFFGVDSTSAFLMQRTYFKVTRIGLTRSISNQLGHFVVKLRLVHLLNINEQSLLSWCKQSVTVCQNCNINIHNE